MVELGRFEDALAAYDNALEIAPEFTEAKENKQKLREWLEQQKKQENQQQGQSGQPGDEDQADDKNGSDSEDQGKGNNQGNMDNSADQANRQEQHSADDSQSEDQSAAAWQNEPDTANEGNSDASDNINQQQLASEQGKTDMERKSIAQTGEEAKEDADTENGAPSVHADKDNTVSSLKDQQIEQWLRRIPDDPGGLLRRKFLQQYQNSGSRDNRVADESRSIW
jgi:Ca-activated chloride channel family protein